MTAKLDLSNYKFSFLNAKNQNRLYDAQWMAPEALKKRSDEINKKSADMWSYSILLWEIFTNQIPFSDLSPIQCGLQVN